MSNRIVKSVILGALAGLLFGVFSLLILDNETAIETIRDSVAGFAIDLVPLPLELLRMPDEAANVRTWIEGEGLPFALGIAWWLKASLFLSVPLPPSGHSLTDYLWRSSPDILDTKINKPDARAFDPYAVNRQLVGRDVELKALLEFAEQEDDMGPSAHWLTGAQGVGKTKLALNWLAALRKRGWEAGILSKVANPLSIRRARFGRRCAIVIDEASSYQTLWPIIQELMAKSRCQMRVLVVDQAYMDIPKGSEVISPSSLSEKFTGRIRLQPLGDSDIRRIAPDASTETIQAADGRPLFALLGQNPWHKLDGLTEDRFGKSNDDAAQEALFYAATAGPFSQDRYQKVVGTTPPLSELTKILDGTPRRVLAKDIPRISPNAFASSITLIYARNRSAPAVAELTARASRLNAPAVARRLATLWTRPVAKDSLEEQARGWMTTSFLDESQDMILTWRERVVQANSAISAMIEQLPETITIGPDNFDENEIDEQLGVVYEFIDHLPFDTDAHSSIFECLSNIVLLKFINGNSQSIIDVSFSALNLYNNFSRDRNINSSKSIRKIIFYCAQTIYHYDLEKFAERIKFAAYKEFDELRKSEAYIGEIENELLVYQYLAQLFSSLGQWENVSDLSTRFENILQHADVSESIEAQRIYAATVRAIGHYCGVHGRLDDYEHWTTKLSRMAVQPRLMHDTEFVRESLQSCLCGIDHYGDHQQWDDMKRHLLRHQDIMSKLGEDADLELVWTRVRALAIAGERLSAFGEVNIVDTLLAELNEIAEDPRIAGDHEFIDELVGSYAAISSCYSHEAVLDAERFAELSRKLFAVADQTFECDKKRQSIIELSHDGTVLFLRLLQAVGDDSNASLTDFRTNACHNWATRCLDHFDHLSEGSVKSNMAFRVVGSLVNASIANRIAGRESSKMNQNILDHVAFLARHYQGDSGVQQFAGVAGLSYKQQAAQGFPRTKDELEPPSPPRYAA